MDIHKALSWFPNHSALGIPLDIFAHFFVGFVITFFLFHFLELNIWISVFVLMALSLFKEFIFDKSPLTYNHEYYEVPKDIFFSWIGLGAARIFPYSRRRKRHGRRKS